MPAARLTANARAGTRETLTTTTLSAQPAALDSPYWLSGQWLVTCWKPALRENQPAYFRTCLLVRGLFFAGTLPTGLIPTPDTRSEHLAIPACSD
jgi:hypothetical protein